MEYSFVEGMEQISADEAFELLKTTYWANKRSREQVEKSMRNHYYQTDRETDRHGITAPLFNLILY